MQLSAVRSGSDGDRPGYGTHSLFRGPSMLEDLAVLIAQAVEKAVRPMRDEIASLKEKTAALEATQATLSDNQFIQLKLTNDLREATRKEPQPMQKTGQISSELCLWPMVARCLRRMPGRRCTFPKSDSQICF